MFITFEGGEGSGKTTQILRLKNTLEQSHQKVLLTREPGGSPQCELIRHLLLEKTWEPLTETFLFNASRHEHCKTVIEPALIEGTIVLCDRFMDSTMVYQGYGLGMCRHFLKTLQDQAVTVQPDLTFIFDLDPIIGKNRLASRTNNNHIDARDLSFHEKVREGFMIIAEENPQRCILVDASQSEEFIFEFIQKKIDEFLNKN